LCAGRPPNSWTEGGSESTSQAGHHLWRFTQLFSNASGTVQFAQLFVTEDNESGVGPFTIAASGHTFNLVSNLPSTTPANTWILVATSNFAALPGAVAPDHIIPANFFPPGGGIMNYAGIDAWSYGTVPTDGVHSLMRDGSTVVNSAVNFAGQSGSVNVATPPVPAVSTWGIALLVGLLLVTASGLLRKGRRGLPA
jgi:serralysin